MNIYLFLSALKSIGKSHDVKALYCLSCIVQNVSVVQHVDITTVVVTTPLKKSSTFYLTLKKKNHKKSASNFERNYMLL